MAQVSRICTAGPAMDNGHLSWEEQEDSWLGAARCWQVFFRRGATMLHAQSVNRHTFKYAIESETA
jgi:hypothetical protein